jgi:hypothetical protein
LFGAAADAAEFVVTWALLFPALEGMALDRVPPERVAGRAARERQVLTALKRTVTELLGR